MQEDKLIEVTWRGDVDEVRRLVKEKGVDPSFEDPSKHNKSALHFACERLHLDVVQYLVEEALVDGHVAD